MTAIRSERFGAERGEAIEAEKSAQERRATEKLGDVERAVTAFEGEIREFVRRDVSGPRRALRTESDIQRDPVTENLGNLIKRVSSATMEEIDRVILELQGVRDMLRSEGDRVTREIAGYASLSHSAMTAMKVIGDSLTQWKSAPRSTQTPAE
ncbi:MAG: hypothetical protein IRY89_11460 [Pseudolabrys sp.]|nr:hypothetical protein [Pseudolabrys sp.]